MHHLGASTAVVTRQSLEDAINIVGEDWCLIIQPYDTSDGLEELDWRRHPFSDSYLMKMAHISKPGARLTWIYSWDSALRQAECGFRIHRKSWGFAEAGRQW